MYIIYEKVGVWLQISYQLLFFFEILYHITANIYESISPLFYRFMHFMAIFIYSKISVFFSKWWWNRSKVSLYHHVILNDLNGLYALSSNVHLNQALMFYFQKFLPGHSRKTFRGRNRWVEGVVQHDWHRQQWDDNIWGTQGWFEKRGL